jgi:hypothetical protein
MLLCRGYIKAYILIHCRTYTVAVDRLAVVGTNSTYCDINSRPPHLVFTEARPCTLRCVAEGGYPAPQLDLYLGHQRLGPEAGFQLTRTVAPLGRKGLRVLYYTSERGSHDFRVDAEHDGMNVTCVASTSAAAVNQTTAQIVVLCTLLSFGCLLIYRLERL